MTSESSESDLESLSSRRIHSNQIMLDLRQQVQRQERIIRSLVAERDRLTRELDSRLFLVEAQLRREQKHIESVLTEKEQLIEFQAKQIYSLKQMLSQVSENQNHYQRNHRSSKRSLSKRYSVALDEYMNDHCTVSRALPVMVQSEHQIKSIRHMKRNRARSLPELRFKDAGTGQEFCQQLLQNHLLHSKSISHQQWCQLPSNDVSKQPSYFVADAEMESKACCRHLPPVILDEISSRRWTSDCDSEHSDSLDSGISSPSIKSRNMHENFEPNAHVSMAESEKNIHGHAERGTVVENSLDNPYNIFEPEFRNREALESGSQKPRRSSSIGNFINRTFSSSSSSEKMKDGQETNARRHRSFSGAEVKDLMQENRPEKTRFINSTNRTFGTNHRSVTKPRDIKFRKLFKFRRRTEPEPVNEDYMTV